MELDIYNLPPPFTLANVLAEWEPREDCEKPPNLRIRFDLENATTEALPLPGPDFGLLFMLFANKLGDADVPIDVLAVGYDDLFSAQDSIELFREDPNHVVAAGEKIHYEGVMRDPEFMWLPDNVDTSDAEVFLNTYDYLGNDDGFLLIVGYPGIGGNVADTAEGETGAHMFVQILPYIEQDNIYAGFQNLSIFYIEYEGSQGYVVLPFEIDPAHPELPNLVFTLPEVSDEVLLEDNVSYALFVFTGGAPAEWDQISQFEVSDFELSQQLTEGWAYAKIGGISSEEEIWPCTPTSTPTSTQLPASATATPSSPGTGPSATPRPTSIPERTPEPTERATPRPTEPPKP
jgi:hypothetical protein